MPEYEIRNIRRGFGDRADTLYAQIWEVDADWPTVSATLEYCMAWLKHELIDKE